MIYALPLETDEHHSLISSRFARSPFFAIIDRTSNTYRIIANPHKEKQMGVGKDVLTMLINPYKVKTLIGFELGFKIQELANKLDLDQIILNKSTMQLNELLLLMKIEFSS